MRLKQNSTTAVVVKKSWADLRAIRQFLCDGAMCDGAAAEASPSDDGQTIFARVLDDTDERGLWIELNTKRHAENPEVQLQALMIPWQSVLAVVVGDELECAQREAEELGLELSIT